MDACDHSLQHMLGRGTSHLDVGHGLTACNTWGMGWRPLTHTRGAHLTHARELGRALLGDVLAHVARRAAHNEHHAALRRLHRAHRQHERTIRRPLATLPCVQSRHRGGRRAASTPLALLSEGGVQRAREQVVHGERLMQLDAPRSPLAQTRALLVLRLVEVRVRA